MKFFVTLFLTAICVLIPAASVSLQVQVSPTPVTAQTQETAGMLVVTSETPDYCERLLKKVRSALTRSPHHEIRIADSASYLFQRGGNLCSTGHIRRGIALERMALRKLLSS